MEILRILAAALFLIGVGVQLVVVLTALVARRRALRRAGERPRPPRLRALVLLPVRGSPPSLGDTVARICGQEGVDHQVALITEHASEPAVEIVRDLLRQHPCLHHVVAGVASRCGQKNHNLLAGLAAFPDFDVYVTADAGILPERDWLARLLEPFADPEVHVSSTHQWSYAPAGELPALTVACLHAYLHASSALPGLVNAWGGSTALRGWILRDGGLAEIWSRAVVDDVAITAWTIAHHKRMVYLPGALVRAHGEPMTLRELWDWLVRQCQFQYINNRPVWWALLIGQAAPFAAVVGALPALALSTAGLLARPVALLLVVGAAITLLAGVLSRYHQPDEPNPPLRWALAAALLVVLGVPGLLAAGLRGHVDWSGTRYVIGPDGRVADVLDLRSPSRPLRKGQVEELET